MLTIADCASIYLQRPAVTALRSYPHIKLAVSRFTACMMHDAIKYPDQLSAHQLRSYQQHLLLWLGPSAVNSSLSYVSVFCTWMLGHVGIEPAAWPVPWVSRPKPDKWWLSPADYTAKLRPWLIQQQLHAPHGTSPPSWIYVRNYIEFTIETGLRVEETLRLVLDDFSGMATFVTATLTVPGTKTAASKATIPLSRAAWEIIGSLDVHLTPEDPRLFQIGYETLKRRWNDCREYLGVMDQPTSTLKSLRRSFAANALSKGLPERIIQALMRHTSAKTTLEYLRLIGLSNTPQVRHMLNGAGFGAYVDQAPPDCDQEGRIAMLRDMQRTIDTLIKGMP